MKLKSQSSWSCGFTLVELAIVLMIIGLLIGGILKGQELIQNARITSGIAQLKNYDAAGITFLDSYGARAGDLPNPSSRLPNCSAAMCNTSGDGNGKIETANEVSVFWSHLAAANLITGVDPSATWTSGSWYAAPLPEFKLGGNLTLRPKNAPPGVIYPDGAVGNFYMTATGAANGTTNIPTIPMDVTARFDRKMDDGKPCYGIVKTRDYCEVTNNGASVYDVNDKSPQYVLIQMQY